MAMVGKTSFLSRILLSVLAICWIFVALFTVFQYIRERSYKTDLLNLELQTHNLHILNDLREGQQIDSIFAAVDGGPFAPMRVTLVDTLGNVIFDSEGPAINAPNHNSRPEIAAARVAGVGHTVERRSQSNEKLYFYSAMRGDGGLVIRTAKVYDNSLVALLAVDSTFLWILLILSIALSVIAYFLFRKIATSIRRLNDFAEKAEKGMSIDNAEPFPDDELGSIAGHIVRLYVQRSEQHRETLRQQQEKVRIKRRLTNNINHELKTPVASILLNIDLLADHPELDPRRRRLIFSRIRDNAERLDSLLKDVATITRMDEAGSIIEKAPVPLLPLVSEIVAEEQLRTSARITVDVAPIVINGNRSLIESIFRNLIDNAIAYSGATVISVTADSSGNIVVRDNGVGVAPEHLSRLFERFYRVDKGRSRAMGGTGLGLSIVRNAVAIHGGDIVASLDSGLVFSFNLPPMHRD